MLNLLTRILSTFAVMKAGSEGPSFIFFIPSDNNVRRMQTAFCSYHERIMDRGKSFTPQLNAFASSVAIFIAE